MHRFTSKILGVGILIGALVAAATAAMPAGTDWKKYFGLTADQKPKFDQANKDKSDKVKTLKDQQDKATETLRGQVDAKASDDQIKGAFAQVRSASQAIHAAEDGFWTQVAAIITPTQQAKLLLKSHPPKNGQSSPPKPATPAPVPAPTAGTPGSTPAQDWKTYFALTPAQKKPFEDANKAKGQTMKQEHEDAEKALEALSQKVDAQASDADIAPAFAAARQALEAPAKTEDGFWDTVAGILTPTQEAKLYLKGKPIKK